MHDCLREYKSTHGCKSTNTCMCTRIYVNLSFRFKTNHMLSCQAKLGLGSCINSSRDSCQECLSMLKRVLGTSDGEGARSTKAQKLGFAEGADASSSGSQAGQPLSTCLKRDWAAGKISSQRVLEYCTGAVLEGSTSRELVNLGKPTAAGQRMYHAQDEIMKALGRPPGGCEFYFGPVPKKHKDGTVSVEMHPFILPHESFQALASERPDFFAKHVLGADGALRSCWQYLWQQKDIQQNPCLQGAGPLDTCVPLGLHVDAGAVSKQSKNSLYVFTWNSLVSQGSTKQTRHIITVIQKSQLAKDGSSLEAIFSVVAWSLNALSSKRNPRFDHLGNEFEIGDRQALKGKHFSTGWWGLALQMRGDWQWYCQCFHFPQWNASVNMCWVCGATTKGSLSWKDLECWER